MDAQDETPPNALVFELVPLAAGSAPLLCDRLTALLLDRPEARTVICDVAAITRPAPSDLDHLARLRVAAARLDRTVRLRAVPPRLRLLLTLTGLADVFGLPAEPEGDTAGDAAGAAAGRAPPAVPAGRARATAHQRPSIR